MSKHRNESILTEPITSVTEMYIEKALDDDSRVQYQTVIYPNHVSGSSRQTFEVIRLDLRSGRFEIVGRELYLATARHVATRNRCQTAEDYRADRLDSREDDTLEIEDDQDCDHCGDVIAPGTINASGCTLTPTGWTCGNCCATSQHRSEDWCPGCGSPLSPELPGRICSCDRTSHGED